jgi:hypothetical protein
VKTARVTSDKGKAARRKSANKAAT